ncbi:MAG: hypothetical protein A2091_11540 [Desulfuromonadales bacterium GWD2_61_12]|nr:MAG: hypothetical protein A2005_07940 [Desulfuromonadales bacterium GWC2_61_20]OGR36386.1 MAG: hypothetical protein A2091_11540 [Desulfuromonadales bacterium GWD2_61_12]HAD03733.1 hypothetical protein [Desulfuromonas sp.]
MDAVFTQIAQEFVSLQPVDLLTVSTLALLEGILSVDNALVLAILVRTLPPEQRRQALTYGIAGAFLFRFIALIFAGHMMQLVAFKIIGGGYLIYLAMKHMFFFQKGDAHQLQAATARSFWKTVFVVELTDIAFSIDSITAAVAMSNKLLVVWSGGILGIIFLRFSASVFVRLLETLPRLEDLAYQLIFFIGTKLFLDAFGIHLGHSVFWMMMGIITVLGGSLVYRDYHQRRTHNLTQDQLLDRLRAGQLSLDDLLLLDALPADLLLALHADGKLLLPKTSAPE